MSGVSGYSSFRHLADALFLQPSTLMTEFSAYFDDSGKSDQGSVLVVAGYIATVDQWKSYDKKWGLVLDCYNVEYFQSRQFIHSTEQFEKWKGDETKRLSFIKTLISITTEYVLHGFSCGVSLADWERVNAIYSLEECHYLPFALCGWHCIKEAQQWSDAQIEHRDNGIEFVFESGSQHAGKLFTLSNTNLGIIPIFRNKRDPNNKMKRGPKKLDTPLQSSDFAAWQFGRHFERLHDISSESALNNSLQAIYPYRRKDLIPLLERVTYEHYLYAFDDLLSLCHEQGISRRS